MKQGETMAAKKKGQLESEISEAVIQFEKEYMGRGPTETKTYILEDLVIIRLKGVLTRAEQQLITSEDFEGGRGLVKRMRHSLLEKGRPMLEAIIEDILQVKVTALHTDLSTNTGERIILFSLTGKPELHQ
jgi:uncharacterized protein YbcI